MTAACMRPPGPRHRMPVLHREIDDAARACGHVRAITFDSAACGEVGCGPGGIVLRIFWPGASSRRRDRSAIPGRTVRTNRVGERLSSRSRWSRTFPVSGTQSLESETPPLRARVTASAQVWMSHPCATLPLKAEGNTVVQALHRDIAETIRQTLTDTELPNGRRPNLAVFSRQIADLLEADCRRSVTSGFDRELAAFRFLGFTFRARAARTKHGTMFVRSTGYHQGRPEQRSAVRSAAGCTAGSGTPPPKSAVGGAADGPRSAVFIESLSNEYHNLIDRVESWPLRHQIR